MFTQKWLLIILVCCYKIKVISILFAHQVETILCSITTTIWNFDWKKWILSFPSKYYKIQLTPVKLWIRLPWLFCCVIWRAHLLWRPSTDWFHHLFIHQIGNLHFHQNFFCLGATVLAGMWLNYQIFHLHPFLFPDFCSPWQYLPQVTELMPFLLLL